MIWAHPRLLAPVLLNHPGFPLVGGVEPRFGGSADLRALEVVIDEQAQFPAKSMRQQFADCDVFNITLCFSERPQIAALDRRAAPDWML
jgi:hypothetical protein